MAGRKPLLLMTRPKETADRFVQSLPKSLFADVDLCISPLLEIENLDEMPDLTGIRALIFTSRNAVMAARSGQVSTRLPAYCVGRATTQAAQNADWTAHFCGQTAHDLIKTMTQKPPPAPVAHLCGVNIRVDIAAALTAQGIKARTCPIYDQKLVDLSAETQALIKGAKDVIVPLFSPRTAQHFMAQTPASDNVHILALSAAVAGAVRAGTWKSVSICANPTAESLRRDIVALLKRLTRVEGEAGTQ